MKIATYMNITLAVRVLCLLLALQYTPIASAPLSSPLQGSYGTIEQPGLVREPRKVKEPRNKGEEGTLFEGDIKLRPGEKQAYQVAQKEDKEIVKRGIIMNDLAAASADGASEDEVVGEGILWPRGEIPWKFDHSLNLVFRNIYARAMEEWEKETCVDFIPVTSDHQDYLLLTNDTALGCSSWVGRRGGEQRVTISQECSEVGHAMHELGHAIGFRHEHSRPDRDAFIEIIWDNILPEKDDNFGVLTNDVFEQVPDVGYDIESIMHYGRYAFSINDKRKPTIEVRDSLPFCDNRLMMGQRLQLSHKDKLRANLLYECTDKLQQLRNNEPECNTTQPTPTPSLSTSTPTPSPDIPSPTILPTPSPTPPPPVVSRVLSGNIITLQFSRSSPADTGMKCSSLGCIPVPCHTGFSLAPTMGCAAIEHQFQIFRDNGRPNIKSGQTVALRSIHKATRWLDCSGEHCTLSECFDNAADQSNASYISTCEKHMFTIYANNKAIGKIIRSDHEINLERESQGFLNCSGKRCKLIPASGQCPNTRSSGTCDAQRFSIQKLTYG